MNPSRVPAGVTTGGQFAAGARSESTATLTPPRHDPRNGSVKIDATWHANGAGWNELPAWPEGVAKPEISWEHDYSRVRTAFWFNDHSTAIVYWKGSDGDTYNSFDNDEEGQIHNDVFGGDCDSEAAEAMQEWMHEVHGRIDAEAYGVSVAAATPDVNAAVIASALGEATPTGQDVGIVSARDLAASWQQEALTDEQMAALESTSQEDRTAALNNAFDHYAEQFGELLSTIQYSATQALLRQHDLDD